jgi:MFS family permease
MTSFFLIVFLQQAGGYRPLVAGVSLLPISILMFLLAGRFGALADRFGPRMFMGVGPLLAAAGLLLLSGLGTQPDYVSQILPGVVLLGLGLAVTVAPLTAAVLSSAPAEHSGLASGVNNAVARIAGLVAIAAVGAVLASHFSAQVQAGLQHHHATSHYSATVAKAASATLQTRAPDGFATAQLAHVRATLERASVNAFHLSMLLAAALALISGILSLVGISNPKATTDRP